MSALPPKADIRQRIEHVCFVPIADMCDSQRLVLGGTPEVPLHHVELALLMT